MKTVSLIIRGLRFTLVVHGTLVQDPSILTKTPALLAHRRISGVIPYLNILWRAILTTIDLGRLGGRRMEEDQRSFRQGSPGGDPPSGGPSYGIEDCAGVKVFNET